MNPIAKRFSYVAAGIGTYALFATIDRKITNPTTSAIVKIGIVVGAVVVGAVVGQMIERNIDSQLDGIAEKMKDSM